jgi:hypothetical protein
MRPHPLLYDINTRVLLTDLSRNLQRSATLDDIPDSTLDRLAENGFDYVWFLGVWQNGVISRNVSMEDAQLQREFEAVLPGYAPEDVCGSCFAVQSYTVHASFGGDSALERLRTRLYKRGLRLILDFVPNHTAHDHAWVQQHPEYYVHATEEQLQREPRNYIRLSISGKSRVFAYGRDPHFPGWSDTLQLDYSNPNAFQAIIAELQRIAGLCDGVRCDIAMLILPDVFERTWGRRPAPFWPTAIERVRAHAPEFLFIAEAYWDLEWTLQQQGFDYTYDKRLYDRLRGGQPRPVRDHLRADIDYQRKSARFLENHDEARAAATFAPEQHQAAAILTYLCPGLRFFHQGQVEGFKTKVPVQLRRGPSETVNPTLHSFYDRLLGCLRSPLVHESQWRLLDTRPAWDGNWTHESFICFGWHNPRQSSLVVVVNYAPHPSQCYLSIPFGEIQERNIHLRDLMSSAKYDRARDDLLSQGLYLNVPAWGYHVFELTTLAVSKAKTRPQQTEIRRRRMEENQSAERMRLQSGDERWKKWGPYLSERQWGTVREDYSQNGDAWGYFSHDQARSRAYRWGEDGLAGISDDHQQLCFAVALWNGRDPIIKERLFGLINTEGNHGEDVKEYYFYLDNTPTHSYMKYLYKYPQEAYPYGDLVKTNKDRTRADLEYELLDTGVFNQNRYYDVFVEYAKNGPEDILIKITAANRGPDKALLHVLPTLWFRNTWSWEKDFVKPLLEQTSAEDGSPVITASHPDLGIRYLYCEGSVPVLFTENETNNQRLFGTRNESSHVKDGIEECVIFGRSEKVNPEKNGTKASPHYCLEIPGGESRVIRLLLTPAAHHGWSELAKSFDGIMQHRQTEADDFYASITPKSLSEDSASVMRQALAGMLWGKQFYSFDLSRWLSEHGDSYSGRNREWVHMLNNEVISMPDKWEYPWYAAWDLAFHCVTLSMVDMTCAKQQLALMVRDDYLHPNGQLPAYEWNFGDVNPPVHAWAAHYIYETEKRTRGYGDLRFLKEIFEKLALNFTWWLNRKDPEGNNIFSGGFLGLDNIGVFDRSSPLPTGGHLEQADGTAWMAFFGQSMLKMAIELAIVDAAYERLVISFAKQVVWIASSIENLGRTRASMWDEDDGFFYDVLRLPNGDSFPLKVRSVVGLLPLCAATVFRGEVRQRMPNVAKKLKNFLDTQPKMRHALCLESMLQDGENGTRLLDLMDVNKYRRVLSKMLDEAEFLGPYGIRSMSRYHLDHPYVVTVGGQEFRVQYTPAESDTAMFGGNSNWRGPVWVPMNVLIIRSLLNVYQYYGDKLKVECPTGSGKLMNLFEVAREIASRLTRTFLRDEHGRRPVYGETAKFQDDPHWRDYILFYEYFHGDNGAGIGASHQTGWTGLVANLIQLFGHLKAEDLLAGTAKIAYTGDTELAKK